MAIKTANHEGIEIGDLICYDTQNQTWEEYALGIVNNYDVKTQLYVLYISGFLSIYTILYIYLGSQ